MSEISAQIMKDIYEDRVELFVLYDKLKNTEGKWQTYGSKGIIGGPNNEHLILSEDADHKVLDQKTILSLIKETFSKFSQSFYRIYCFAFHVPNGNDMINSFKLSFALAHKDLRKIALQLSEKTVEAIKHQKRIRITNPKRRILIRIILIRIILIRISLIFLRTRMSLRLKTHSLLLPM